MGALLLRDAGAAHGHGFSNDSSAQQDDDTLETNSTPLPCLPPALANLAIGSLDTPPATPGLAYSSPPSPAPSSSPSTPHFYCFMDLPTELRLKIWHASFIPRVVEIHRRRSHYADTDAAYYQSWSANPAALAVSYEARACALRHYTAAIRLAVNTPCELAGGVRLDVFRRLYIAPHTDTLAVLGDFDVSQTLRLLTILRTAAAQHASQIKLAICASSIGQASLLHIYGSTVFHNVEQLTLFLYEQRVPPAAWRDGHCALVDCRGTYQYRRFLAKQAAELRVHRQGGLPDDSEEWITVGQRPLQVRDLVFGDGATLLDEASSAQAL